MLSMARETAREPAARTSLGGGPWEARNEPHRSWLSRFWYTCKRLSGKLCWASLKNLAALHIHYSIMVTLEAGVFIPILLMRKLRFEGIWVIVLSHTNQDKAG